MVLAFIAVTSITDPLVAWKLPWGWNVAIVAAVVLLIGWRALPLLRGRWDQHRSTGPAG